MVHWSSCLNWTCFPSAESPGCTCSACAFVGLLVIHGCTPCALLAPPSSSALLFPLEPSHSQHLQGKGGGEGKRV